MGLAITKALVEAHGGTISAASAGKGRGATFTVELSATEAPAPAPRPPAGGPGMPSGQGMPPKPANSTPARALRILLVEDHAPSLSALRRLVTQLGHHVAAAATLRGAREIAAGETFDLILSDLGLPDGTGHDLMREVNQRHGTPGIALSGYGMEGDVEESRRAGFREHLTKPVDVETLQSAIGRATAKGA